MMTFSSISRARFRITDVSGTPSASLNGSFIGASGFTWLDHFAIHARLNQNAIAHPTNPSRSSFIEDSFPVVIGSVIEVLSRWKRARATASIRRGPGAVAIRRAGLARPLLPGFIGGYSRSIEVAVHVFD
jgi:hypothetical protein